MRQLVRQLVYTMFISYNRTSFHLRWKENLVEHRKVSKYYETGFRYWIIKFINSFLSRIFTSVNSMLSHSRIYFIWWDPKSSMFRFLIDSSNFATMLTKIFFKGSRNSIFTINNLSFSMKLIILLDFTVSEKSFLSFPEPFVVCCRGYIKLSKIVVLYFFGFYKGLALFPPTYFDLVIAHGG